MRYYMMEVEMFPGHYNPRFAFTAINDSTADSIAFSWAKYHGFNRQGARTRHISEQKADGIIHNDYIDHVR